jgi:thiol-disulfide isomerase/thioredoxin
MLSQKNCRPCQMMEPIIEDVKRLYSGKLKVVVYKEKTKERRDLQKIFYQKVDLRYTPSFLLLGKKHQLLSYSYGYSPKQKFLEIVNDGIDKFNKLETMKITKLIYICDDTLKFCKSSKIQLDKFLAGLKSKPLVTNIDMKQYKTREDWLKFYESIEKYKYLYGWKSYPAIIASTKDNEVVHYVQNQFDQKQLQEEFSPFLK